MYCSLLFADDQLSNSCSYVFVLFACCRRPTIPEVHLVEKIHDIFAIGKVIINAQYCNDTPYLLKGFVSSKQNQYI